ncbi:trypsin-like [Brevipalpus obovatus]|uniref:trypsin-like n=1 Tax=Brevipalpus obovatus TaxID=246614 RepID=UPI003D9EAACA
MKFSTFIIFNPSSASSPATCCCCIAQQLIRWTSMITIIAFILLQSQAEPAAVTKKPKSQQERSNRNKIKQYFKNCGLSSSPDNSHRLRIIGGREASRGSWPWQVALLNHHSIPYCGGTIITPQFVLTAAHCVRRNLYIRAGEHDLTSDEGSEQDVKVAAIYIHPNYSRETVDSDVALLHLATPLKMNKYVSHACLPSKRDNMPINTLGTILGWGKRKNSAIFGTDKLHQAKVPIANITECRSVYEDYYISNNMICAGFPSGRIDSCAGDSGGPLLVQRKKEKKTRWAVYGITSFGEGCGRKGKYGIYVKVPNFVKWIRRTIYKYARF